AALLLMATALAAGSLAAGRFTAGRGRAGLDWDLLLHRPADHAGHRDGFRVRHTDLHRAGAWIGHHPRHHNRVGLGLLLRHAPHRANLIRFLAAFLLVRRHAADDRLRLANPLHAGDGNFFPHRAGAPDADSLHRRRAAGLAAVATILLLLAEPLLHALLA